MGWKDWRSEDAETIEEITKTVDEMHRDEARDIEEHKGDRR